MVTQSRILPGLIFHLLLFAFTLWDETQTTAAQAPMAAEVSVGVILDLETLSGKKSLTSIKIAVDDFYAQHPNYTTRIVLHAIDSKQSAVDAAAAAVDLLKNENVSAIIGLTTSTEAEFVVLIGNATQTPIISYSASSDLLSVSATPYFVRATVRDSYQSPLIAAVVKSYGWHEVDLIYEDTDYGIGILPSLVDALQSVEARVTNCSVIAPSASDDRIATELYRLKTLPTRVFVVHMMPSLASRFFRLATKAGMVVEGYAWIATDGITDVVDMAGALDMDSMQGVIGVKPHVPSSPELETFTARWRARFRQENPEENRSIEPSLFQLWAYDATHAVAAAVEKTFPTSNFTRQRGSNNSTYIAELGIFEAGPQLLAAVQSTDNRGLSGDFRLAGGELNSAPFEIINFNGKGGRTLGFWTPANGISGKLGSPIKSTDTKLKAVIWPGGSATVPKGWEISSGGKKLQIAVPVKSGFNQFVDVQRDSATNAVRITGYCIDVFDAVMAAMPYSVQYKYIPFNDSSASYDNLVSQVYYKNFDATIGDITILANRSDYVEFTLPYTESGVALVVPLQRDNLQSAWVFLKPLTTNLWLGSLTFFIFTGFVVWAIEHRNNPEFRGRPHHQFGTTFYFIFSTLVFSHKEKLENNLSRLVVVVWVFVVLILTSSYAASLTSKLTMQQLQPAVVNMDQLLKSKARVGYQDGSFVLGRLRQLGFSDDCLQNYSTPEQYKDAMVKGSAGGGVAAVLDEIPYLKIFLSMYCTDFAMVGQTYKTGGFGFVFPRGSPLVPDVSRAILNVTEGDTMINLERKWLGDSRTCLGKSNGGVSSLSLNFRSFSGLFLITGAVSAFSILVHVGHFIWNEWDALKAAAIRVNGRGGSIWKKMAVWGKHYDRIKHDRAAVKVLQSPLSISRVPGTDFGSPERIVSGRTSTVERPPDDLSVEV